MITQYADINDLLQELLEKIKASLSNNLIGAYLYGSLVHGDFNYNVSDIDLFIVIDKNIDEKEFIKLDESHKTIVKKYVAWQDRLEVLYISKESLSLKEQATTKTAIICPGDPFHIENTDYAWIIINTYLARNKNIRLFGQDLNSLIPEIPKAKFLEEIKNKVINWKKDVVNTKGSIDYQLYVVLTLCRALYVIHNRESVSKLKLELGRLSFYLNGKH